MADGKKSCIKCFEEKNISEFYRHPQTLDKHDSKCSACAKAFAKNFRTNNPELKARSGRIYREKYHVEILAKKKLYKKQNCLKVAAYQKRRKASIAQRTPKWLSKDHKKQMRLAYSMAKEIFVTTGVVMHVDHIVPLLGKNVSGLHVPWNLQIITAEKNIKKGRNF